MAIGRRIRRYVNLIYVGPHFLKRINYFLVLLNENFKFTRPLTVTGAFYRRNQPVFFHQMVLDRVESDHYIVQNNLLKFGGSSLQIPVKQAYYAESYMLRNSSTTRVSLDRYLYENDGVKMFLVNENVNDMKFNKWYLIPQAYSFSLVKK